MINFRNLFRAENNRLFSARIRNEARKSELVSFDGVKMIKMI